MIFLRLVVFWGDSQAGYGSGPATNYFDHALLWNGTAESAIDLNPVGFESSYASDVAGGRQVGSGAGFVTNGNTHALLWNGTAQSVVDLHVSLLALGTQFSSSFASSIGENGNIVGFAYTLDGVGQAVLWIPIPEPCTAVIVAIAIMCMSPRHFR